MINASLLSVSLFLFVIFTCLFFWIPHVSDIIQYLSFSIWLISSSIIFSKCQSVSYAFTIIINIIIIWKVALLPSFITWVCKQKCMLVKDAIVSTKEQTWNVYVSAELPLKAVNLLPTTLLAVHPVAPRSCSCCLLSHHIYLAVRLWQARVRDKKITNIALLPSS